MFVGYIIAKKSLKFYNCVSRNCQIVFDSCHTLSNGQQFNSRFNSLCEVLCTEEIRFQNCLRSEFIKEYLLVHKTEESGLGKNSFGRHTG